MGTPNTRAADDGMSPEEVRIQILIAEQALLAALVAGDVGDATAANQTTEIARLDSILAKIIAAPATEAKQDNQITAEQAILARLSPAPTLFKNLGANATLNVKASAGSVYSLSCFNANAAVRYVQLHNTATVPATGVTVPIFSFPVQPAGFTLIGTDFFTASGAAFATGIAFAFSTTRDVYTAGSAGDQTTHVNFS